MVSSLSVLAAPIVVVETSFGKIEVDLDSEKAPISVNNFLNYVDSGFYNQTIMHRVVKNFVIQGGGLDENLIELPTQGPILNESKNSLSNLRGTIGMARDTDPNTATSQFFINLKDNTRLDYQSDEKPGYAVFGKVISGLEVVDAIAAVTVKTMGENENVPEQTIKMRVYRKAEK
jgi:cyclophilin family peptidyl-prolyl cis-trans isomerase